MAVTPSGRDDQAQRHGDHGGQPGQTGAKALLGRMLRAAYPLISLAILLLAGCATTQKPILDLKITNGRILDGTGAPWFRGDIGVRGDTIVAVGDLAAQSAASTIDAHGRIVSPGFIDLLGQSQFGVFADPHLEAKVRQGVTTDEIIALARVGVRHGRVYFSHIRDEGDHIDAALDEAFRIGREAGIPVNIWHMKPGGRANWGKMPHVIERINAARVEGLDVAANVYPYAASGTSLSTLAPDWALEGGWKDFQKRLQDPESRAKIAEALRAQVAKRGEKGIYVGSIPDTALAAAYNKKYIEEIAAEMNVPAEEALIKLFTESTSSPIVIFFSMNENDVQTALKQPFVSVGSDPGAPSPQARAMKSSPHPRAYRTFARVVGAYVRGEHLVTLE